MSCAEAGAIGVMTDVEAVVDNNNNNGGGAGCGVNAVADVDFVLC